MKTKLQRMNAREEDERLDVGGEGRGEVVADPGCLPVVKLAPILQVVLRLVEDLDAHAFFRSNRSFTSAHSRNSASPFATRSARAASTSPCQAGEGTPSGE